ncbi:uncharacterized protein EV420DRAFT_1649534 [Desarmillaria tabescens]|uniref:F-box domain-containing protein n=1 Tax=Armillaria tabescens TaxID=1929756 RepID=A0AA39MQR5_ARMTA|nr:uncharacterized protein EV420DRAFT_1649534 [Desarmillaria tabescens]KAK0442788.1 hypothetical protein EV420DRAFT_1649534 [Desarmillaria tabescens]
MKCLAQYSSQWEDIHLPTPSCIPWTQLVLLDPPSLHLPSLRSLIVDCQPDEHTLACILDMFKHMPKLKSFEFHLNGTPSDFDPKIIPVLWQQLTHLAMSLGESQDAGCWLESSVRVLRLCPNLETLSDGTGFQPYPEPTPVSLPRLRSLRASYPLLLNYLICPALEHLEAPPPYDMFFAVWRLSQFTTHSGCQILSIKLNMEGYDRNTDIVLLNVLTSDNTNLTLPDLNVLELKTKELFTGEALSEELDEALVRTIDSRWNISRGSPVAPLRQVHIKCSKAGIRGDTDTQK